MIEENYGKELILDLHDCDPDTFNQASLTNYFMRLCKLIDMERCDLHFWDDAGVPENEKQTDPKTKGISAIQFIITSNIIIHALDLLKKVFINVFSCKDFDCNAVMEFTENWFKGICRHREIITRY